MRTLFGAFGKEADEAMLDAYVLVIVGMPYDVVRRAVLEIIKHDRWLPKASELRQAVRNLMPSNEIMRTRQFLDSLPPRIPRAPHARIGGKVSEAIVEPAPEPIMQTDDEAENVRRAILEVLENADATD